ncbi:hypothetical protein J6590_047459 [Homalodisca vitripennis]|nr:hypothetical protein J6590_047459 [Homalodisca vitripennis]
MALKPFCVLAACFNSSFLNSGRPLTAPPEDVNDLLNPFNIHQWAWCEFSHYDPRPQESALTSCVGSSQLRTSSAASPYADADIVYIEQRSSLQYAAFLPLGFDFLGIEAMQAFRNKAAVAFTRFSAVLAAISTSFLLSRVPPKALLH